MSFIGLLAMIGTIVFGIKSGNSDFFVLAGLLFVGTCILDIPRMIHKNTLKRMKLITDFLTDILEGLKDSISNKKDISDEQERREFINNIIKKYIDNENN